jgi:hypothetical protein
MPNNTRLPDKPLENPLSTNLIYVKSNYNRFKYNRIPNRCLEFTYYDVKPFNRFKLPNIPLDDSINQYNITS